MRRLLLLLSLSGQVLFIEYSCSARATPSSQHTLTQVGVTNDHISACVLVCVFRGLCVNDALVFRLNYLYAYAFAVGELQTNTETPLQ